MTPGAGEKEEGEEGFLSSFFLSLFFFSNLLLLLEKIHLAFALVLPPLSQPILAPSLPKCCSVSFTLVGLTGCLLDFVLFLHFVVSAEL